MSNIRQVLVWYEVHIPMPYCEVWVVRAKSKKDAKRISMDSSELQSGENHCIGEISSRRKKVKKLINR